ncbi:MAG TPA: metal-sensitive transcriptional regulator [Gemmatimonadota bacterium]|nr:metal-sensitive transcriptional regulator [Gemmatimonadota bacterium]
MSEHVGEGAMTTGTNTHAEACACGCQARDENGDGPRKAVGVDPELKAGALRRLRRIEGQVRGLQRMVEEERYCADILTQVSSVHEALRSVGRELMRNHLAYCATRAIQAGGEEAEDMYDELVSLMYRHAR